MIQRYYLQKFKRYILYNDTIIYPDILMVLISKNAL